MRNHSARQLIHNQDGAVAALVAVCLVVFIAFTALAIDVNHLYVVRNELQNAADAGALAGARFLLNEGGSINTAANTFAYNAATENMKYKLENKDMSQEEYDRTVKYLNLAEKELEDIQNNYDKIAYGKEEDLLEGRKILTKEIQDKVKENLNIDLKFPLLTSPEEWAVGKQPGLDLEASEKRKVRDYPEIKNLREFKDKMGEKYAGTEGFLFFKPGAFMMAEELKPGLKEELYGDYIMGRREGKELEDLYSSLEPKYANQLSTLEKEDLLYGLKRKLIAGQTTKQQLEEQGFDIPQIMSARPYASGGIASLTTTIPPKKGPNHQGLASLKKYGKQY